MSKFSLSRWLHARHPSQTRTPVRRTLLDLQSLESREVPATHIWTDLGATNFWSDAGNWSGGKPTSNEVGGTIVQIPLNDSTMFQDIPSLVIDRLEFKNSGSATLTLNAPLGLVPSVLQDQLLNTSGTNTITGIGVIALVGSDIHTVAIPAGHLTIDTDVIYDNGLELHGGGGLLEFTKDTTYTGNTYVYNGILRLNGPIGGGPTIAAGGQLIVGDGIGVTDAYVQLGTPTQLSDTTPIFVQQDGVFALINGSSNVIGDLTIQGGQVSAGAGSLGIRNIDVQLTGTIDATSGGHVTLLNGQHTINVTQGQTLTISAPIHNAGAGAIGGIIKDGEGELAYHNANAADANSYTGVTLVKQGTLSFLDAALAGSLHGDLIVGDGLPGAATVLFHAANQIPTATNVTVNSDGKIDLNGHTQRFDSLTVHGGGQVLTNGGSSFGHLTLADAGATPVLFSGNAFFVNGTLSASLNGVGSSDRLKVNGTVNLINTTLDLHLLGTGSGAQSFKIIDNDGADAINGIFKGLNEGAQFHVGGHTFRITYKGGDGNDVVVTEQIDLLAVSAGPGAGSHVRVFNDDGSLRFDFAPFGGYDGGVTVATGDVTGDGLDDIIVGAGAGTPGGHVKVFDGATGAEIRSFLAFDGFLGGVNVGAGDLDGDGHAEILVGAGAGTPGGHIKAFDGVTGAEVRSFFAYDGFVGGVNVAAGDLDGDGRAEIITGTATDSSHVKAFDGKTGALVRSFLAFDGFPGGISVGAADINGDGKADILVGAATVVSHVKAFDGVTSAEVLSFIAFDGFPGGVHVAGTDRDGDGYADIAVGAGTGGNAHLKVFSGLTEAELASFFSLDAIGAAPIYVG